MPHILYLSRVRLNPYVTLLAQGVRAADPRMQVHIRPRLTWSRILLDPRWRLLNLHWIEHQYAYGPTPHDQARKNLEQLLRKLRYLQRQGRKLVYTVHNLTEHEARHPDLNHRANAWIFQHADAIHVHNQFAAQEVARRYGRTHHVFIIPHGNYIGVYPQDLPREQARKQLDIPSHHFVFLCLGQMRPYKGLDELIAAFLQRDMPDTTLILAGQIPDATYAQALTHLAGDHPNIRLFPQYVPPEHVQRYCNASDVCVLPYRDATTSGAALLAFSFGKPVIAPAIGPFPELLGDNQRGLLFHPGEHDLGEVLARARHLSSAHLRTLGQAARAFAEARNWRAIGAQHIRLYRELFRK